MLNYTIKKKNNWFISQPLLSIYSQILIHIKFYTLSMIRKNIYVCGIYLFMKIEFYTTKQYYTQL